MNGSPAPIPVDALQEINRLRTITRMFSNAAHDINNALQVISGSAELLAVRTELGAAEQRRLQTIGSQTGRAASTLDRVMAYLRTTSADRQTFDIGEVVETALALRAFAIHRARIAVTVERAGSQPYGVSAYRRAILQVCLNLLLNAEDALAERRDTSIRIRLETTGGNCEVSFADNGPGMSAEEWRRRVDATVAPALNPDLSGLGLWVSSRIAEQHGGRLLLDSAATPGASITLRLPAVLPAS